MFVTAYISVFFGHSASELIKCQGLSNNTCDFCFILTVTAVSDCTAVCFCKCRILFQGDGATQW